MSFLLQVPRATKQDSVAATSEWQRKLEAAEALLTLKNSCQPPPDFLSLQQPGSMPGSCLHQGGTWGGGSWEVGGVVVNWLCPGSRILDHLGSHTSVPQFGVRGVTQGLLGESSVLKCL